MHPGYSKSATDTQFYISESFSYETQHGKDAVDVFNLEEGLILTQKTSTVENSYEFPLDSIIYMNTECMQCNISTLLIM